MMPEIKWEERKKIILERLDYGEEVFITQDEAEKLGVVFDSSDVISDED